MSKCNISTIVRGHPTPPTLSLSLTHTHTHTPPIQNVQSLDIMKIKYSKKKKKLGLHKKAQLIFMSSITVIIFIGCGSSQSVLRGYMDVKGWQCIIYHLSRSACKIRDIDSDRLEAPVEPLLKLHQNPLSACTQLWCALRLHINILTWILVFPASQNKRTKIKKKKTF